MATIKLKVIDARNDEYEESFDVENDSDGFPQLFCGLCGSQMCSESCANGHIALTIIDEDVDEKVRDASAGKEE